MNIGLSYVNSIPPRQKKNSNIYFNINVEYDDKQHGCLTDGSSHSRSPDHPIQHIYPYMAKPRGNQDLDSLCMWYLKVIFQEYPRIHLTFGPLKKLLRFPRFFDVFSMEHQAPTVPTCANSPLSCHPFSCENQRSPRQSRKAAGLVPFIGTSTGCPFRSMQTKIQTLQVGPRNMVGD